MCGRAVATAVVASAGGVLVSQMVDYDPWGLELSGLGSGLSSNRAKFNGKETLAELGGGLLDFGARGYDATIGRWGVVDPLAEVSRRFSPFVYGNDNPVGFIDPDGMMATRSSKGFTYSDGYSILNNGETTGSVTYDGAYQSGGGGNTRQSQGGGGPGRGQTANSKASMAAPVALGTSAVVEGASAISLESIFSGIGILINPSAIISALTSLLVSGDTQSVKDQTGSATISLGTVPVSERNLTGHNIVGIQQGTSSTIWYEQAINKNPVVGGDNMMMNFKLVDPVTLRAYQMKGLMVESKSITLPQVNGAAGAITSLMMQGTNPYNYYNNNCTTNCSFVLGGAGYAPPVGLKPTQLHQWFKTQR